MNPDPSRFYDTEEAAILAHISEQGIRKILRGKKNGNKTLIAQQFLVNKRPRWFIEKWVYHLFLQNEIIRFETHINNLRESLRNPEEKIRNGRNKT